jgi:hypothetical protein
MTPCLICYGGPLKTNRYWLRFANVPRHGEFVRIGASEFRVRSIVWKTNLDPEIEDAPSDTRTTFYPFIACSGPR